MEERIVIVTPFYNPGEYLSKCLDSIDNQTIPPYKVVLLDDVSDDDSPDIANTWVNDFYSWDDKPGRILFRNQHKCYQVRNYWEESFNWDENDIIVLLDGDDWFSDNEVLERIAKEYEDHNTWMTYGQFQYPDGRMGFAREVDWSQDIRKQPFTATHLRTFRAWLFNEINVNDLKMNGEWPAMTGDQFFMFPMLEMCGPEHAKFLPYVNYIYNDGNPLNDHKVDLALQNKTSAYVRSLPAYGRKVK